jgi:hypothetical protein
MKEIIKNLIKEVIASENSGGEIDFTVEHPADSNHGETSSFLKTFSKNLPILSLTAKLALVAIKIWQANMF